MDFSSLTSGANKYLLGLLGASVLIIGGLLYMRTSAGKPLQIPFVTQYAPTPTSSPTAPQALPLAPPEEDPFEINTENNPLNKLAYEYTKQQLPEGVQHISEGRFQGRVVQALLGVNKLTLQLEGMTPNSMGKTVWYSWDGRSIGKVNVFEGENTNTTGTLESVQAGDVVYIDEMLDYSKPYPDAIISVKITRL